jgi:glycosyltransferase involved in cell wall biosynthesis
MRILTVGSLYPPHHLGGYELVWQAAVRALREAGHEVRVLCSRERFATGDGAPEDGDVHRELRWYWRDHAFPRMSMPARLELERRNRDVMERHLASLRPDVVSWWPMGGMSLSLLERVRRAGIPSLACVNDDWLLYGPKVDPWTRVWRRPPLAWAPVREVAGVPTRVDLAAAARYVFCSHTTREAALRAWPRLADGGVLHPGVAPEFAAAPEQPWGGRLLYAGRLDERKGLLTLVDAVAAVADVTLRISGGGDARFAATLRERIAARGVADRVHIDPGPSRSAVAVAYAEADAVVFPVEWPEPWGLVPLEAMAVGRPVIASGQGGSAEYLEHERNALIHAPGDAGSLAAAIRRLAGDPDLRGRLRQGGFETAARLTQRRWAEGIVAEHERALPSGEKAA